MLSAEFHDRLVTVLVDCLDDNEEPGIILESVGLECLRNALKKYLPDKNIPAEALNWLIETYCDVIKGIRTFINSCLTDVFFGHPYFPIICTATRFL